MKAYFDNSIVSARVKGEFPDQQPALDRLLAIFEEGAIDLVTSKVTQREIAQYQGRFKGEMGAFYARLSKVPTVEDHVVLGFHNQWGPSGGVSYPLVSDDRISTRLRAIGLGRTDAHHVMVAIRACCDVFLTFDRRTILKYRTQIEKEYEIRFFEPVSFVESFVTDLDR